MKIRMRNPEFPLYFIVELGFGIFLFLDSPYKVISLKEKCIMILICVIVWNIVFMISRMRIIANYAQTECQFRYCGTAIPFLTVRSTAR